MFGSHTPQSYAAAIAKVKAMRTLASMPPATKMRPSQRVPASSTPIVSSNSYDLLPQSSWTNVGPAPVDTSGAGNFSSYVDYSVQGPDSGRVTAMVVVPGTVGATTKIYVGTMGGGVWKTLNNGASWTPLTDNNVTACIPISPCTPTSISLSIGALALDAANPNIIYAGSGEGNAAVDSAYGM